MAHPTHRRCVKKDSLPLHCEDCGAGLENPRDPNRRLDYPCGWPAALCSMVLMEHFEAIIESPNDAAFKMALSDRLAEAGLDDLAYALWWAGHWGRMPMRNGWGWEWEWSRTGVPLDVGARFGTCLIPGSILQMCKRFNVHSEAVRILVQHGESPLNVKARVVGLADAFWALGAGLRAVRDMVPDMGRAT